VALAFQPRDEDLGRYRIVAKLGHGGMAELYLAKLVGAGGFEKLVAIKRMLPHLNEDPVFVGMFENEGRIAARLNHPNVCTVYELGEAKGGLFLAMEFLQGLAWSDIVDRLPRDDQMICARIITGVLVQACAGLAYAHDFADVDGTPMPVVHRDVSPANLFVQKSGVVKLLDFGVSKVLTEGRSTRTGIIKGKLPYMSPEQIRGEPVDRRADVFSIGACAWEAATGRLLFERPSDYQIWKAVTEEPIPKFASGDLQVLEPVILSALARERDDRCASVQEFAARLRTAVEPLLVGRFSEQLDTLNRRLASVVQRFRPNEEEDPTTQRAEAKRSITETKINAVDAPDDDETDHEIDAADDHTVLDAPMAPVDPMLASVSGEMTAMSPPPGRAETPPPVSDTIKEARLESAPDISENVTARRDDPPSRVLMSVAQGGWAIPKARPETPLPIGRPRWVVPGAVALAIMILVLIYLIARSGPEVPNHEPIQMIDAPGVLDP
jgi:serine/threonine protein kinase